MTTLSGNSACQSTSEMTSLSILNSCCTFLSDKYSRFTAAASPGSSGQASVEHRQGEAWTRLKSENYLLFFASVVRMCCGGETTTRRFPRLQK